MSYFFDFCISFQGRIQDLPRWSTERAKRATLWGLGRSPEFFFNLGGSNVDVQLLSSHMEYEFNIIYFCFQSHNEEIYKTKAFFHKEQHIQNKQKLESALVSLDPKKRHTIKRAGSGKHSSWLTVIPVAHEHFDLSPTKFRDALAYVTIVLF